MTLKKAKKLYHSALRINLMNKIRYGKYAPRYGERIWVKPHKNLKCKPILSMTDDLFERKYSGVVRKGDWDINLRNVIDYKKIQWCIQYFEDGKSWVETGAIDHGTKKIKENGSWDGFKNEKDIIRRYQKLDGVFESIKREGRLKTAYELGLSKTPDKEIKGVYFHVDRNGEPIFAGAGWHRLAIAIILKLPYVPAQLGVVHPEGIKQLKMLREPPQNEQ